ncbi:hypothetical protein NEOLEDRAFT_946967 [Neolentinus lepideus HHB14362 ss-1]|uniref:Uncharacterized protein n=1 Tax=Neolentinus lepideus HHB14362 ss-1 TaxID=1314782 RepID=A0A165NEN2_9AGAM|nr:hypothetical protein NEOLEDRAFT_946967 [Neolentinus lepideus HHB14362 ss-1]
MKIVNTHVIPRAAANMLLIPYGAPLESGLLHSPRTNWDLLHVPVYVLHDICHVHLGRIGCEDPVHVRLELEDTDFLSVNWMFCNLVIEQRKDLSYDDLCIYNLDWGIRLSKHSCCTYHSSRKYLKRLHSKFDTWHLDSARCLDVRPPRISVRPDIQTLCSYSSTAS